METLALLGTQFDDVLITTRNTGALVSGRGGYAPIQTTSGPLRLSQRRVSVRIATNSELSLIHCQGDREARFPSALAAVDRLGRVQHRVQYVSDFDACVAESLEPCEGYSLPQTPSFREVENVISLPALRRAREGWDEADAGQHLNDLMVEMGKPRHKMLPYIGKQKAWRVLPQVLQSFFNYLDGRRYSFTRFVPASAVLQADVGAFERVNWFGSVFFSATQRGTFSLDLDRVEHVWLTASPRHWQLEIYDADERALAVLAPDPNAASSQWKDFLLSLPRLG
jgi:putative heme degradation protein